MQDITGALNSGLAESLDLIIKYFLSFPGFLSLLLHEIVILDFSPGAIVHKGKFTMRYPQQELTLSITNGSSPLLAIRKSFSIIWPLLTWPKSQGESIASI